ncbi:MAG: PAS domain S-box-containing protein [Cyclobacteriaceae bacterium]|jgi:PAS domain S-box-containing protein
MDEIKDQLSLPATNQQALHQTIHQTNTIVGRHHLDWLLRWRFNRRGELDDPGATADSNFAFLQQPAAFIAWPEFRRLTASLTEDLSDDALAAVGQTSWQSHHFQPFRAMAQSMPRIQDSYELIFGAAGIFSQFLPCTMALHVISPRHMTLTINMNPGLLPCENLHQMLAGQLNSLLQSTPSTSASTPTVATPHDAMLLMQPMASVTRQPTQHGAIFEIRLKPASPIMYHLRRWLTPLRTRQQTLAALTIETDARLRGDRLTSNIRADLRHTQHAANLLQDKYDTITRHMTEAVCVLDNRQHIIFATPSIERWLGYTPKRLQSLTITQILAPTCARRFMHQLDAHNVKTSGPTVVDVEFIHQDGYTLPAEIEYQRNAENGLIIVARSLSHIRNLQSQVAEAAANYESVVRHTPEAIIQINHVNEIIVANNATQRIFGYDQQSLIGKPLSMLLPGLSDDRSPIIERNGGIHPWQIQQGCHRDGQQIPVEINLNRQQQQGLQLTTVIVRDISHRTRGDTERSLLQQQLQAAQRMEAVGQLTSGVAHDFNNLLVAINGYTELCLKQNIKKATRDGYLNEIHLAGKLAAELTNKLLAFSRPQVSQTSTVDLNQVIANIELLIRRLLPNYIDIDIDTTAQATWVWADPGQLEQVILNLVINARDAITDVGHLQIVTRRLNIDSDSEAPDPTMSAGTYIQLIITDSGTGMTSEALTHLFKPFFTTKPEGLGTGLGLSVVHDIIKQHQGAIQVDSRPGQGSRFSIYLPAGNAGEPPLTATPPERIMGGTETLLLVEDSQPVRDLARLILRGVGYNVIEARDGPEALDIFAARHEQIALVIMDVVMPRMGGQQAMHEMRKLAPDMRLVFTSGYEYNGTHTKFVAEQGLPFISKPYSTDVLCERIRALLDTR